MAGTTGLEPATSAVTGQRSNQLSYVPKFILDSDYILSKLMDLTAPKFWFAVFAFGMASFRIPIPTLDDRCKSIRSRGTWVLANQS
jgi:hypothetical protein